MAAPQVTDPPTWLPDSAAKACMKCGIFFTPIRVRRHHCRVCGGIFCSTCSSFSIKAQPSTLLQKPAPAGKSKDSHKESKDKDKDHKADAAAAPAAAEESAAAEAPAADAAAAPAADAKPAKAPKPVDDSVQPCRVCEACSVARGGEATPPTGNEALFIKLTGGDPHVHPPLFATAEGHKELEKLLGASQKAAADATAAATTDSSAAATDSAAAAATDSAAAAAAAAPADASAPAAAVPVEGHAEPAHPSSLMADETVVLPPGSAGEVPPPEGEAPPPPPPETLSEVPL